MYCASIRTWSPGTSVAPEDRVESPNDTWCTRACESADRPGGRAPRARATPRQARAAAPAFGHVAERRAAPAFGHHAHPCRAFLRGHCRFGGACRFGHAAPAFGHAAPAFGTPSSGFGRGPAFGGGTPSTGFGSGPVFGGGGGPPAA